jgi:3-hydroxy-9,10-secoandrosta-1,3,5(10)-triene-9,17-dione monooxygenase reductase component
MSRGGAAAHPEEPRNAVDARELRTALGAFPTGVTIVTTRTRSGDDIGLTVNSFSSVSLDPPLVLWSLSARSASRSAFAEAEYFAIHVLSAQQQELASRFARKEIDRFAGLDIERGLGDTPLLQGCAARFTCRRAHEYAGGDHVIIIGEIASLERFERPPLAFHGGKYAFALPRGAPPPVLCAAGDESIDPNAINMLVGVAHACIAQRLAPRWAERQLTEQDYWLLSIIGAKEGRTVARLSDVLAPAGVHVDGEQIVRLRRLGYLDLHGEGKAAGVGLTDHGRRALVEFAALSVATETPLERGLNYAEGQLLWELLRRLIVSRIPTP